MNTCPLDAITAEADCLAAALPAPAVRTGPTRGQRWRARRRARALLPTSRIGLLIVFVQADAILLTVAWTLALRYHVHFPPLWAAGSWRP